MNASEREQVAAARGGVRDAVFSLSNLHSLLRSPKVGPRQIGPVLPEIQEGLLPLGDDAARALAHVAARHPSPSIERLVSFAREAAADLSAAVAQAMTKEIDARGRLTLEAAILRVAPGLDAARWLMDLVLAAADETPAELDLHELLEDALAPSSQRGAVWGTSATVQLFIPPRGLLAMTGSTRVAIPLIHIAVAHVHAGLQGARGTTELRAKQGDPGVSVEIVARPGSADPGADSLVLRAPLWVAPTADVLSLVNELCGCAVSLPSKASASVAFPPALALAVVSGRRAHEDSPPGSPVLRWRRGKTPHFLAPRAPGQRSHLRAVQGGLRSQGGRARRDQRHAGRADG